MAQREARRGGRGRAVHTLWRRRRPPPPERRVRPGRAHRHENAPRVDDKHRVMLPTERAGVEEDELVVQTVRDRPRICLRSYRDLGDRRPVLDRLDWARHARPGEVRSEVVADCDNGGAPSQQVGLEALVMAPGERPHPWQPATKESVGRLPDQVLEPEDERHRTALGRVRGDTPARRAVHSTTVRRPVGEPVPVGDQAAVGAFLLVPPEQTLFVEGGTEKIGWKHSLRVVGSPLGRPTWIARD